MRLGTGRTPQVERTTEVSRREYNPEQRLSAPFDLSLHVETVADLASLWARFNMSAEVLSEAASEAASNGKKGSFSDGFVELLEHEPDGKREVWKFLNGKLKENNIQPR